MCRSLCDRILPINLLINTLMRASVNALVLLGVVGSAAISQTPASYQECAGLWSYPGAKLRIYSALSLFRSSLSQTIEILTSSTTSRCWLLPEELGRTNALGQVTDWPNVPQDSNI